MASSPELTEYLCVDAFLRTLVDGRALKSAFELKLIQRLEDGGARPIGDLGPALGVDPVGLRLLVDLLLASGVLQEEEGQVDLHPDFRSALRYRDLLEAKLEFAGFVTPDFLLHFTQALIDPPAFQRRARLFKLFDYQRCYDTSIEAYEQTKSWMKLTTAFTRYEARACVAYYDFASHHRMLDIGGNSGEFVLQICKAHPELRATVFDLPLVCQIGQEHVLPEPECDRISFVPGSALDAPLPTGCDLISFKSMLHDWPEEDARRLIARAGEALQPGGTLLVFERSALAPERGVPFSLIPMLLFFRSFGTPAPYEEELRAQGFEDITCRTIELETPFFLLTARKPV